MAHRPLLIGALVAVAIASSPSDVRTAGERVAAGPASWANDLSPIAASDWSYDRAAHLVERAGFGAAPAEIERLAAMSPRQAVASLVNYESIDASRLRPFDESGIWDPGM